MAKFLIILLALFAMIASANAKRRLEIKATPIPEAQVIDATHLRRTGREQVEVFVVQQAKGAGLLVFHLNGRATAKLEYADWIRLYLRPGRYRLGVSPSPNFGRATFWEMSADVTGKTEQIYRIFQSAGFTSSGGNAVFEIAPR
jgi:hypothetical protein